LFLGRTHIDASGEVTGADLLKTPQAFDENRSNPYGLDGSPEDDVACERLLRKVIVG
jgi:hypothetical protein